MKLRFPTYVTAAIAAIFVATGCAGHSGAFPVSASHPQVQSRAKIILSGTIKAPGPQLFARTRSAAMRRPLSTTAFFALQVNGSLFEDASGPNTLTTVFKQTCPCAFPYSVSVPFSDVPIGNNQLGMLQFYGVDSDSSLTFLGTYLGFVNVTSSTTNTATLNETTTQTAQIGAAGILTGEFSPFDLTSSTFSSTLATNMAGTGIKPDPVTLDFDPPQVSAILTDIFPKYERDLTIAVSPFSPGTVFLVADYTNQGELNLAATRNGLFGLFAGGGTSSTPGGPSIIGGGLLARVPVHEPEVAPNPVPPFVNPFMVPAATASTVLRGVYGGPMMVVYTNNTLNGLTTTPFDDASASIAARAAGSFLISLTPTLAQKAINMNDPDAFAYGFQNYNSVPPLFAAFKIVANPAGDLSQTSFFLSNAFANPRVSVPSNYGSSNPMVFVETMNAWNLSTANMALEAGTSLFQLNATGTDNTDRLFADFGNNLAHRGWKPGGVATSIIQMPSGYQVNVSGPGTVTLTSTTPSFLGPQQGLTICGTGSPFAPGIVWTAKFTDTFSNTYINSGNASGSSCFSFKMLSANGSVKNTNGIVLSTTGTTGSFTIQGIH